MTLDNGKPFNLEPFQRTILGDYFAGTTETLVLLSKKNGKSTLVAALALFHLLVTPDAECCIAAASREQAGIILKQARKFINGSPALARLFDVNKREILSLADDGVVRVYASDVHTADGVIPTLALVDELHRHKSADLYGVFRDGLGPRGGQMITISTAGDDEISPLGAMRRAAVELPSVKRDGAYTVARSPDFVMHEWALQPDEDRSDMAVVKLANPASWQTEKALARRFRSPSMNPTAWARFACGIWMQGEESWITPEAWDACSGRPDIPADADAVVGVDIGQKKDSTAVIAVSMDADGRVHVAHRIMVPEEGRPIAITAARAAIAEFDDELRVLEVPYDPFKFAESAELLEERGLLMVEFPQTDTRMAPASEDLYELIMDGRLVHDGDPELRAQILAAVPSHTERGVRISKRKSKRRIDAAVALAMAVSRLLANQSSDGPMFEVIA